jgi:hypothetical protein
VNYKVIYHIGETIDIGTKAKSGRLILDQDGLHLQGETDFIIPRKSLQEVEMTRLHGSGRMLKIKHVGGTLFLSVIRFHVFGYFAVVNYFATGRLLRTLESLIYKDPHE